MGQKVDPRWLRAWVTKSWASEWFAKTKAQSSEFFVQDIKMRNFVEKEFVRVWISKVVVRKTHNEWEVIIFTSKTAQILGKDGEKLKAFETKFAKKFGQWYKITLKEIRVPELSAKIIAEFAASQIEARMPYRKVGKSVLEKVMQKWATGVKIMIAGRLWGTDIARSEKFIEWRVSLQTFRADIDYHYTTAMTKYGIIGIKVWISKGEIFAKKGKTKTKEL